MMLEGVFSLLKKINNVIMIINLRVTSYDPMVPFKVRVLKGYQVIEKREDPIFIIMEEG